MSTTIESLRKLGLKVNGSEPTSDNIGNVINEIADEYTGGGGSSAGVSSIGGVDGAITLGEGLSMSGQQLQVAATGGGTQLYKHTFASSFEIEDTPMSCTIDIVSTVNTAITSSTILNNVILGSLKGMITFNTGSEDETHEILGLQVYNSTSCYFGIVFADPNGNNILLGIEFTIPTTSGADTVTAL